MAPTHPLRVAIKELSELDGFAATPFPHGHPPDRRTFYSPVDDVHGALCRVARSARSSLIVAMYGFDDDDVAEIVKSYLADPKVFVQLTLDSSQAGGLHEKAILAREDYPAASVAVGRSEHGAIMHMKLLIVDGTDLVTGSTNWSSGGESKQDNELTVRRSPLEAIRARQRVDVIHAGMVAQMLAKARGAA